ncbi:DUF2946 family protein [Algihabitans sp.]|uniref:DUF2946 family protein n=1 Tax=Algihabitans sp. TaxID=2821514 RepID=UPI003BAC19D0
MQRPFRRLAAALAVVALLVNLAGHVSLAASLPPVDVSDAAGPIIVICTPSGMKLMAWTPEGFVDLSEGSEQGKQPCPLCGALSGGALLPAPILAEIARTISGARIVELQQASAPRPPAVARCLARAPPASLTV